MTNHARPEQMQPQYETQYEDHSNENQKTTGILMTTKGKNSIRHGKSKHVTFWDEQMIPGEETSSAMPQTQKKTHQRHTKDRLTHNMNPGQTKLKPNTHIGKGKTLENNNETKGAHNQHTKSKK